MYFLCFNVRSRASSPSTDIFLAILVDMELVLQAIKYMITPCNMRDFLDVVHRKPEPMDPSVNALACLAIILLLHLLIATSSNTSVAARSTQ
jgi:hypothetical protein